MKFKHKCIFLLIAISLLFKTCPRQNAISSGPFQAIKCGLTRKPPLKETFVFDKRNGYLYSFDFEKNRFIPINRSVNKEPYSNSMEEFSSILEINKLKGNKLIVTYIDYYDQEISNISIIKKAINLRWLIMYTSSENLIGERQRRIDICKWVNPREVNSFNLFLK